MSERVRTSDNSVLQLVKGKDENIKQLPLEDGRLSFAVDSKKIYLDCDFTDSVGDAYNDRLAFGGSSGIYYGVRTFTTDEIENKEYIFSFPEQFDIADEEIPSVDDLVLNNDGCFYRVNRVAVENNEILIYTTKLTVAGSGGGSGGSVSSGLTVAKDPNQLYNIIAANKSIPIGFKVIDALSNTTIDVTVSINGVEAGTFRNVTQNEYTTIDLYRYVSYFILNNNNTVVLRFTNEYDHAAQLTLRNIRLIALEVKLQNNNLGVIQGQNYVSLNIKPYGGSAMYDRFINIGLHTPGQLNVNTTVVPYSAIIDNGETYVYTINNLTAEGNYTVDVWITAHAEQGDTELLASPTVTASFIYRQADSNIPMLSASIDAQEFNQYDIATITYLVAYDGTESSIHLSCYKDDEPTPTLEQLALVSNNIPHTWKVTLSKSGVYRFVIAIESFGLEQIISNINVLEVAAEIPVVAEESLQLYLDATDRSNNEMHPDTWIYNDISCNFENFNWSTNGWITDNNNVTSLHLTNGAKLTVPFAIFSAANCNRVGAQQNGKTIEFNFKLNNIRNVNSILINAASWIGDKVNTGIICTGDKICMNTANLTNYHTPEEDMLLSDSEKAATNGLRAYLTENERVHIAFVVGPVETHFDAEENNIGTYGLIYTYINGVLSGLTKYNGGETIVDSGTPSIITVDSTNADIDIYSIRVYNNSKQDSILLNNYAADLPTIEQKLFTKANNDVLASDGTISLAKVRDLGNIPYLVVTDLRATGDKKGNLLADDVIIGYGPNQNSSQAITNGKKDFRWAPCYYVDPQHPDRSFGDPTHLVDAVMYGQGTSSLAYPVKNFRLRFCNKADKYSLLPAIPGIEDNEAEQEKWGNVPKVALFTIKADYMDSSMAHNIGTGNLLAGLYDSVGMKSPAQIAYPDKTLSLNIVGHPMIVFWRTGEIGTETFIGRYNFNTDKAEHSLFGFEEDPDKLYGVVTEGEGDNKHLKWGFQSTLDESEKWDSDNLAAKTYYTAPDLSAEWQYNGINDGGKAMKTALAQGPLYEYVEGPRSIQCWEFLNNGAALDGFRKGWDGDLNEWVAAFESRYPEHQETKVDKDHKYQFCSDNRGFARLINWLHSTDQSQATNEPLNEPVIYDGVTFTVDTKECRLAKFKSEFDNYMVKNFTIFYYIMTEALLMIDSRAKNMMMVSFDLDQDANTGHWFPIFYDMDTILGVDNSGVLRYSYDVDDEIETIYNASANYGFYDSNDIWHANPNYSVLWCNLREGFQTEIKSLYNTLRSTKFNLSYLLSSYNTQQADAWAEIYDNQDGWYKYIRPLTEVTTVTVNGVDETRAGIDWIHAEQGTRSMHRKHFLEHRFAYLDSKYNAGTNGTETIYMRVNVPLAGVKEHPDPHPLQFDLISQSTQYGCTKFGGNGTLDIIKLPPNTVVRTKEPIGVDTAKDIETYIFDMGDIYDIGDLSDKFLTSIEFKKKTKLRRLQLGNASPAYLSSEAVTISGWNNLKLLEVFDIQNAKLKDAVLDTSNQLYFRELYAKGSNITAFEAANGGNIQHLELPSSITSLIIKNNLFYDTINHPENLQFEGYNHLNKLIIEGCPLVNTYNIVYNTMIQDTNEYPQISFIRLPDVEWHIDEITSENCVLGSVEINGENETVINDIKIIDYISRIANGIAENGTLVDSASSLNKEYFGGNIYINNDDCYVNDLALKNKYSYAYPNLHIIYSNANNIVAGYNINIINADTNDVVPAGNGKTNSKVVDVAEANGFNLKNYLENNVLIPEKPSSQQWVYTFKGWTSNKTWSNDGGLKSTSQDAIAEALATGYAMNFDEQTETYTFDAPESLPLSAYTDKTLNLYPIFEMSLREYEITYYKYAESVGDENNEVWEVKTLPYGSEITLPDTLPSMLELDSNDKSHTTVRPFITYKVGNRDYTTLIVDNAIKLYPEYEVLSVDMREVHNPPTGYFEVSQPIVTELFGKQDEEALEGLAQMNSDEFIVNNERLSMAEYGVILTIKENVKNEAICVPKMVGDKYTISLKNRSPYVKRIYFEEGCPIRYFIGESGFNGTFTIGLDTYSGFTDGLNTNLEFIDLQALTQLHTIGGIEDANRLSTDQIGLNNQDRVFAGCPNLEIGNLPDSLMIIGSYAFAGDTSLKIPTLPRNLIAIQNHAFYGCTGLETIRIKENAFSGTYLSNICDIHNRSLEINLEDRWPVFGRYCFAECTNLNFRWTVITNNESIDMDYPLQGVASVQEYAFINCKHLVLFGSSELDNFTLYSIGTMSFANCSNITLKELPQNIEKIGDYAFSNCGTIGVQNMPASLANVGEGIFFNDTISNPNNCNLIWYVPNNVIGDENPRSPVNVSSKAFDNAKLNNNIASFYIYLPENSDIPYETYEPWVTAANSATQAFGLKLQNREPAPVVFIRN